MSAYEQTCKELNIANKYWNASVSLLNVNTPNNHVIPSNGNNTIADLTPALFHKKETREKRSCVVLSASMILQVK